MSKKSKNSKKSLSLACAFAASIGLVVACGSGAESQASEATPTIAADGGAGDAVPSAFPGAAYASSLSDAKLVKVEVRTSPAPPVAGMNKIELTIVDATTGAAVDGLTVGIVPWMPAMGHGTSIVPTVTPEGSGLYLVTNVSLFMPGTWELRTTLAGPVSDHVAPSFQVP